MLTYDTNDLVALETSGVAINKNDNCDLDITCVSQNQLLEELIKLDNDEIAQYLTRGIERQKPRLFQKEYEKSFLTLARIVRDILSIPASGTGIKRLFNCACDICYYRYGQLKPSIICGLMLYQFTTNFDLR